MKPATIYDVARRAGVSHQTVTRFLRGSQQVRPETGERVAAALRELDYRPNAAARLLRSRKTNRIGLLADKIDANGPVRILNAASETAHQRGYVLDVIVTDGTSSGSVSASLAVLMEHQVAGILATVNTAVVLEAIRHVPVGVPLVLAPSVAEGAQLLSASEVAGQVAADHLHGLGHRRVGYLAGPEVWLASQDRARGFAERFAQLGGEIMWTRHGDWTPESGYAAWSGLGNAEQGVTAVAVANDGMAIGLMAAAADMGKQLPRDLSVIGTDDVSEARYLRPSLTTVAMDFEHEGRVVMEALLARIEGIEYRPDLGTAGPTLLARDSTAPAPESR